jgi:uncharacterized membrane-anchored protein
MRSQLKAIGICGLLAACSASTAQSLDDTQLADEEAQFEAIVNEFMESLDRRSGVISLGDDLATLSLPEDFYFLGPQDADRVLVDLWGNPPGEDDGLMGMMFPARYTPFDEDSWAVIVEYVADGHVSDSDAADIDYADLLREMQRDTLAANDDRVAAGYDPVRLVGWAEPPHYDADTRKLYWAKEVKFGDSPVNTLNYEIRSLGRTGILSMTFIASRDQLQEINASRESVLQMASFNAGSRYEDFDSNIDEVAAYGIGALIAGKVAAKAGLLTGGILLLKKFGIFIVIGFAALARKIKGMFSRPAAT